MHFPAMNVNQYLLSPRWMEAPTLSTNRVEPGQTDRLRAVQANEREQTRHTLLAATATRRHADVMFVGTPRHTPLMHSVDGTTAGRPLAKSSSKSGTSTVALGRDDETSQPAPHRRHDDGDDGDENGLNIVRGRIVYHCLRHWWCDDGGGLGQKESRFPPRLSRVVFGALSVRIRMEARGADRKL
jgi:hypothetical protein